jgi:type II secretory ATPase GspE/PulE/Tfp pilus assembly ATPase PilB-like protein
MGLEPYMVNSALVGVVSQRLVRRICTNCRESYDPDEYEVEMLRLEPGQKIYRGKLKDLARIVHDNKLTLTTMLVVGEAIDNREGLSELYNKHFTHLFRQGDDNKAS